MENLRPKISLIVPCLNEGKNLPLLAERISNSLGKQSYEIIIVDDNSQDGTFESAKELSQKYPLKLLVRTKPLHGLSGAVLHGIENSAGEIIVVMDADLQHPPEKIPALLEALEAGSEFVLGSRYIPGGATYAQWTLYRRINSGIATALSRPLVGPLTDPMSGFFALRRQTFEKSQKLSPLGYKIALELICKCRVKSVSEIPIQFGRREYGESKLTLKQQFYYLLHLGRLYNFKFPLLMGTLNASLLLLAGTAILRFFHCIS